MWWRTQLDEVAVAIAAQRASATAAAGPSSDRRGTARRAARRRRASSQEQVALAPHLVGVAVHADRKIEVEPTSPPRSCSSCACIAHCATTCVSTRAAVGAERERVRARVVANGVPVAQRCRPVAPARALDARRSRGTRRSRRRPGRCAHASTPPRSRSSASSRARDRIDARPAPVVLRAVVDRRVRSRSAAPAAARSPTSAASVREIEVELVPVQAARRRVRRVRVGLVEERREDRQRRDVAAAARARPPSTSRASVPRSPALPLSRDASP